MKKPMGVYTCKKCGKQYETQYISDGYCEECSAQLQDKYSEVREYLWNHPGSTASEIAKACGVTVHMVMQWVKDERFMVSDDSKVALYCESCGIKIFSGRFCEACKVSADRKAREEALNSRLKRHAENMHGTSTQKNSNDDGRMRFLR